MTAAFVVDSSVLIAIINDEKEAESLQGALFGNDRYVGWPTIFETRIWMVRRAQPEFGVWLEDFVGLDATLTVPFDGELEAAAHRAFDKFGKGRHSASLNFGDCMTYAVADVMRLPLLFKGGDFGKTDIAVHPASVVIEREDI